MLSRKQQQILDKAREFFLYGDRHPGNLDFRDKIKRDFAYYYGNDTAEWSYGNQSGRGQWLQKHWDTVEDRKQTPITVNLIKRKINALVSSEVNARRRIAYRSHIRTPQNNELAKAFTGLGYYLQEVFDLQNKASHVFRDMNVCGLGWMNVFEDKDVLNFDHVHPWDIVPDMDDLSINFTNMRFVGRKRWMNIHDCKELWKNFDEVFQGDQSLTESNRSAEYDDRMGNTTNVDTPLSSGGTALICELQYKEKKPCYSGVTTSGYPFVTFDEDEAEKTLDKKQPIEETIASQVMRTLFCGGVLLEHEPLKPRIPDLEDFTYIPAVYDRCFDSGIPDGLVSVMIPSQTDINVRRTKAVYLLNSVKEYVTGNIDVETTQKMMEMAKSNDSLSFIAGDVKITPVSNMDMGMAQLKIYQSALEEMEQQTGIHPEMMGDTTGSNQSGRAISQLQSASLRSQNFAFDSYTLFKKRIGRMMASIMQNKPNLAVFFAGKEEEYQSPTVLNSVEEDLQGNQYIANDVRGLPMGIYVEETGDFESSFSETKAMLSELLANPNAGMLMENEELLELLGFREAKAIVASSLAYKQRQMQMQEAAKMQGGESRGQEGVQQ